VEDVLGREPVRVEIDRVGSYLGGRTVLVTGAGGSIGAELSRQIARVGPKKLVLLENAENALFEIRRQLEEERHFGRAAAVLADCKEEERMREVFSEHRPSIVFHAANRRSISGSNALISRTRSCMRLSVRPSPARRIFWKTLMVAAWYQPALG